MISKKYSKGYFITLKGDYSNPRYQKIGWAYNHFKKISDNFIVVQESNKANNGVHYHGVVLPKKTPHKGWFTKGVHINIKKIGGGKESVKIGKGPPIAPIVITTLEKEKMLSVGFTTPQKLLEDDIADRMSNALKTKRKDASLMRLTNYIFKETQDYQECVNGKFYRRQHPGLPAQGPG